jgi:hypothetical protein
MTRSRWIAVPLVVLGLSLAIEHRARACSHPSQNGAPYLAFPLPGTTDVPTNVVATVNQATYATTQGTFAWRGPDGTLRDATSTQVGRWGTGDLGTTSWRVGAAVPLSPQTAYELLVVDGDIVQVLGRLTTGDGPDLTPPAKPEVAQLMVGAAHSCTSGFQCCSVEPRVVDVRLDPSPASEPVAYSLREADTVVGVDQGAPLAGFLTCGTSVPSFNYSAGPDRLPEFMVGGALHELTLVARDRAGNESPPVTFTLMASCRDEDQGNGELPPRADGGGGCSVGTRQGPTRWALLAVSLGLFGFIGLRRTLRGNDGRD